MTQLSKADACALLHISSTTLWRRIKAGVYKCNRSGEGQFDTISFTHADLGLAEPTPTPTFTKAPTPAQPVVRVPEPDISTPDAFSPQEFRDSFGHRIEGNDHHKMFETQPLPRRMTTDEHMPDALKNKPAIGTDGQPIYDAGSDNHPINAMMIRTGKMKAQERPMTDAERRRFVDRAAFRAGLAQGFSR